MLSIRRWLMLPALWRFLGFASTVIGLLCFAFSSSFKRLIGGWNSIKIILYTVSAFIICVVVLFAKSWQQNTTTSSRRRLKAHMAFLVLVITSVYSFFFDLKVNRKPDAYSLISCAAFATMSLSLSMQRRVQCGFEVDLFYFFLGFFIIQLMKIKPLLGIAGAGFAYSLFTIHSSLLLLDGPIQNENSDLELELELGLQDRSRPTSIAIQMDSVSVRSDGNKKEEEGCALLITPQQDNADSAPNDPSPNASGVTVPGLMHIFDGIRKTNLSFGVHVKDLGCVMDAFPLDSIDVLRENVKLMVAGGFEKKCSDEYSNWRREFLKECLLQFEKCLLQVGLNGRKNPFYKGKKQKKTERWIKLSDMALRVLLPYERTLCDRVFSGFSSAVADISFMRVCSEVMSDLLNSAYAFVNESHLPSVLQVFGELRDLLPDIESLFSDQYSVSLRTEAFNTCQRLWEASRHLFMELENSICRDIMSQAQAQGTHFGGVCPITLEVMWYLRDVAEVVSSSLHSVEIDRIVQLLNSHLASEFQDYTNLARGWENETILYKLKAILHCYNILGLTGAKSHRHNGSSLLEMLGISSYDQFVVPTVPADRKQIQMDNHICPTNEKEWAFGCGHMVCRVCGFFDTKCPMCQKKITFRIKVFRLPTVE